jgi:aarF domain-containing kinase
MRTYLEYTTLLLVWAPLCTSFVPSTQSVSTQSTRAAGSSSLWPPYAPLHASTMEPDTEERINGEVTKANRNKFGEGLKNSGIASAAAMATAAVNAAVSMKTLEAPDVKKSYISMDRNITNAIDEEGLPLIYDKDLIEAYWTKERGALNKRWAYFVGKAVPFLTKLTTLFIRDGKIAESEIPALSRQARMDLQDLGPTFIKAGQMMSVRPDVLPQATLDELTTLQDSVVPFDTVTAVAQIERELGGPLGSFFTSISEEPVAAASLAQVYLATLADGSNTRVAIKVQRPDVLSTVSKDLYVLRRAAEVFQGLIERFAPQQKTNYVALLNEWAIGFYTELDFENEAANQRRLRDMLIEKNITDVTVPLVYDELCTRRLLVSEWMDGRKLSDTSPEQIAEVTPAAQEAFLTQLFDVGFFHADPHPGNLLLLDEPTKGGAKLALIDCGLMASIDPIDRDNMISAVIHLANKDYAALVDDFIKLQILPADSNRAAIVPLMDKALSPYVKGGGAKKYEEELKKLYGMEDGSMQSQVGGFQAMTQDALTVLNDIPFSVPPYFAILGRAIVTLEGVALTGNSDYGIIMESYPFIARKLLREGRPEIQKALQEVLYSGEKGNSGLKLTRLLAILNNAAGSVSAKEGATFVDLDAVPEDGISLKEGLRYLLSDNAESLRNLLESEVDNVVDVISRQIFRRGVAEVLVLLTPPRPPALPFLGNIFPEPPSLEEVPLPILLPRVDENGVNRPSVGVMSLKDFTHLAAPKLSQDEEIYALGIADGAREFFGNEIGDLIKGERVLSIETIDVLLKGIRSGALGRSDILSSNSAKSVIDFVETALSVVRRGSQSRKDGVGSDYTEVLGSLSTTERARLDDIITELTQRALKRVTARLEKVDRLV